MITLGYTVAGSCAFICAARKDENAAMSHAEHFYDTRPWRRAAVFLPAINRAYERGFEVVEARMSGALPSELED